MEEVTPVKFFFDMFILIGVAFLSADFTARICVDFRGKKLSHLFIRKGNKPFVLGYDERPFG